MNRLAVFDCDGTLVDSGGAIYAALVRTFDEHRREVPTPEVGQRVIGLSLVEAMAGLAPEAEFDECIALAETYKRHFAAARIAGEVEEPLFPGVLELLDALEGEGWLLAVATGKSDRGLRHCLDTHGIHARFVSLQTGDRHPSKPHPSMIELAMAEAGSDPSRTMMIGDTTFDMLMGQAANTLPIGVAWGYHGRDELIAAGAAAVVERPMDIAELARTRIDA